MLNKGILENSIFFDIETAGSYRTLEELKANDKHLAELWVKRCKWLQKQAEPGEATDPNDLWMSKSSLHPEFGRIVCISFGVFTPEGTEKMMSFYGDDERDILEKANKVLSNSRSKSYKLAGQNIKNFDVPYLGKRMIINKITPDPIIQVWNKKPWETSFLDLAEIFSFGAWGQTFSSLDLISHVLGVPTSKDNMEGSQVHDCYWNGKNESIKDYCEQDVVCTMNCFKRLTEEY